ncbi:MAG: hypothetical protein U1F68_15900 [Gammaproteobacteria bacterium]
MKRSAVLALPILLASILAGAGGGLARGADTPVETVKLGEVVAPVPSAWLAEQPSSSMRLAQFRIPAADTGDAELVVFYFGPGQGGTADANIARWRSQFSGAGGAPVTPTVHAYSVAGMAVTEVELQGNYARGVGVGPVGTAKADQTLLAAIVESPQGKLFVQLHGPTPTVTKQRDAFEHFVRDMRPATP